MSRSDRDRDREDIRGMVDKVGELMNDAPKAASRDPVVVQWAIATLTAQGVLVICNLAETIDARGDEIPSAIHDIISSQMS